jgi:hypothetical protein
MPDHILTLLYLIGFIAVIVFILVRINNRDRKKDTIQ